MFLVSAYAARTWSVTVADSGGITGMESGFTMFQSGNIYVWSTLRGIEETNIRIGSVSREQAREFMDSLSANLTDYNQGTFRSGKTLIHYIEIETNGIRKRTTWSVAAHINPPDAIHFWYDKFLDTCESME